MRRHYLRPGRKISGPSEQSPPEQRWSQSHRRVVHHFDVLRRSRLLRLRWALADSRRTWNGSTWSIVPSPNQGSDYNFLYGVSCTSPTYCVAVGDDAVPTELHLDVPMDPWDGIAWSVASSPSQNEVFDDLNGVSCTSPTNCIAVSSLPDRIMGWVGMDGRTRRW